jgi:hypothetical protein
MKTYVIQISNGNPKIVSEHSDINSAKVKFHSTCQNLWNSKDVVTASVAIVDENLDVVQGYKEFISHVVETNE